MGNSVLSRSESVGAFIGSKRNQQPKRARSSESGSKRKHGWKRNKGRNSIAKQRRLVWKEAGETGSKHTHGSKQKLSQTFVRTQP